MVKKNLSVNENCEYSDHSGLTSKQGYVSRGSLKVGMMLIILKEPRTHTHTFLM